MMYTNTLPKEMSYVRCPKTGRIGVHVKNVQQNVFIKTVCSDVDCKIDHGPTVSAQRQMQLGQNTQDTYDSEIDSSLNN